jgi:hypothetical protein
VAHKGPHKKRRRQTSRNCVKCFLHKPGVI